MNCLVKHLTFVLISLDIFFHQYVYVGRAYVLVKIKYKSISYKGVFIFSFALWFSLFLFLFFYIGKYSGEVIRAPS